MLKVPPDQRGGSRGEAFDPNDDRLIPDPQMRKRYGVSEMTVWRWDRQPDLGFPPPIRINGRKYRRFSKLLAWEATRDAGKPVEAA
jgi:predicted DNA-binding transcriptional regulator AlpA